MSVGAAPGKVILLGEHAVVYGRPALAAALSLGLVATAAPSLSGSSLTVGDRVARPGDGDTLSRALEVALAVTGAPPAQITVQGTLPLGVGLGSSAALAVAVLRALFALVGETPSVDALLAGAHQLETVFHGTPSGLDHTVVALGGCLRFVRGEAPTPVPLARPLPLVIALTPRVGSTRDAVSALSARHQAHPAVYGRVFDHLSALADEAVAALSTGAFAELGALFNVAHGLLNACGVSDLSNEALVARLRAAGALGAKLTGAGLGGATLGVFSDPEAASQAAAQLAGEGLKAYAASVE